jgi:predicted TIM-barrel fold metal-dependent hydrolase
MPAPGVCHIAGVAAYVLAATLAAHAQERSPDAGGMAAVADHHQHVFSPELIALMSATAPASAARPRTADDVIAQLDAAGIARAVVLSTAYIFEQPSRNAADAAAKVRRDNDWTSQQVARFPDRLIGFCGINPLKAYALDELARCAADPHLRRGLKLHFGNSVVDYHNPAHVEQVRRVFRAANQHGMAIVVHMRASVTQQLPYGRDEALIFIDALLPAAPDVVVQVAHLAGAGSWQDQGALDAFEVLADAVARGDARTRLLHFDVTGLGPTPRADSAARWMAAIRRVGLRRVVFGSDATLPSVTPRDVWATLRRIIPLTDDEYRQIAANVPPYMR